MSQMYSPDYIGQADGAFTWVDQLADKTVEDTVHLVLLATHARLNRAGTGD